MVGITTAPVLAQPAPNNPTGAIYTCTDATGRKITSDRPIDSCMDRDQRVLSRQGWQVKVMPPALTDAQRTAQRDQERQMQLAQQRQGEQQRVNDALLIRYPNRATHETGRRATLAQTQSLLADARQQMEALESEHTNLTSQTVAYAKNPEKTPAQLKRDAARNAHAIEAEQQLITGYQTEINRINAQFDAEDQRLQPLWQGQ